jgi:hypothetical protein
MPTNHDHEWIVFSCALSEVWLMLQCIVCGAMGTVDDPTKEEWNEASYSPVKPYIWSDNSRVTIRDETAPKFYVVRRQMGENCGLDCPYRTDVGEYERFPGEIIHKTRKLTAEEQKEFLAFADFVEDSDVCSLFLPAFIEGCQQHTGGESLWALRQLAQHIDAFGRKGLHFRPAIAAMLLREFVRINSY